MPLAGGDKANPDAASGVYETGSFTDNAPLWEGDKKTDNFSTDASVDVTADDANQGSAGTCYLIAALGAIAHIGHGTANAGNLIKDIFVETGDPNVWEFYYLPGGEEVYVTVNRDIPIRNTWWAGDVHVFGNIDDDLNGEMWVSLLEKSGLNSISIWVVMVG